MNGFNNSTEAGTVDTSTCTRWTKRCQVTLQTGGSFADERLRSVAVDELPGVLVKLRVIENDTHTSTLRDVRVAVSPETLVHAVGGGGWHSRPLCLVIVRVTGIIQVQPVHSW